MEFDPYAEVTLSQAMSYLVHPKFGRNFYAMTLSPLLRVETTKFPAMAVGAVERRFALYYNPEWVNDSEFEFVVGVIEHEALHLVLEHLSRSLRFRSALDGEDLKLFSETIDQYAADMAVNSLLVKANQWMLDNKFETMVMPDHYDLPRDKSYEWYVRRLMERAEKDPSFMRDLYIGIGLPDPNGDGQAPGPGQARHGDWAAAHDQWDRMCQGMSDEEKESLANELERQAKEIIKKTTQDYQKMCGSVPGHLQSHIEALLEPPRIPWTRLLRAVVVNTKRYRWNRSVSRPNRRHLGIPRFFKFPGRVKDRVFHVVFAVDTSGSMSDPELALAFNELQHLQKVDPDIKITIIEADIPVQRVYEVGHNDAIDPRFTGRGGTQFDAALVEAKKHEPDIMLYYTDGGGSAPRVSSRVPCPFFWLLTPTGYSPDESWGRVLRMEDQICG
jgi:predicted metal-dependent peptidase